MWLISAFGSLQHPILLLSSCDYSFRMQILTNNDLSVNLIFLFILKLQYILRLMSRSSPKSNSLLKFLLFQSWTKPIWFKRLSSMSSAKEFFLDLSSHHLQVLLESLSSQKYLRLYNWKWQEFSCILWQNGKKWNGLQYTVPTISYYGKFLIIKLDAVPLKLWLSKYNVRVK